MEGKEVTRLMCREEAKKAVKNKCQQEMSEEIITERRLCLAALGECTRCRTELCLSFCFVSSGIFSRMEDVAD
ncbi:hypothetical protein NC653_027871 [Populus alba x Populus x berolinensis]|uniref:Uncharacterized protein n=1 Tax=Populus alba x Populus x berolinensis TaxID=444605 RepID=A0AAD6M7E0_9ROSI|nr:hypothetical protein NC653_027871 [Populus alba x Populus x berolinensis]